MQCPYHMLLWGFLKPLAQLLGVATQAKSCPNSYSWSLLPGQGCSLPRVALIASHCLIDGSDSQRLLLPNDGGYPRCWPTGHLRHGKVTRMIQEAHLFYLFSHNVPINIQGAEIATKSSKISSLVSMSTNTSWENKGQNK